MKITTTQIHVDISKLKDLAAKAKSSYARVGVLGGKAKRSDDINNYELAIVHEFGTDTIPPRSWGRMPIESKKKDITSFVNKNLDILIAGNISKFFNNLGAYGLSIIQDAFATRGFGKWAKNAPATIQAKGSDSPLIDTGAFRKSMSWDIKVSE